MDEDTKNMVGNILHSFVGCLFALMLVGIVVMVVCFAALNGAVKLAKDTAVRELSSMSIACSEAYTKDSFVLTLNGIAQYCAISRRPEFDEFDVNMQYMQ